jgi:Exportin-T
LTQLSKGFNKNAPEEVQVVLVETVAITYAVLEAVPTNADVRNKVMVFVQRMIYCGLGRKLITIMSQLLLLLVEYSVSEDIVFVAQIFIQLCIQLKQDSVQAIDAPFLPFVRKCHRLQQEELKQQQSHPILSTNGGSNIAAHQHSTVAPHVETEQLAIEKLLFGVIQHIVSHNATAVLLSPNNHEHFEMVLLTMSDGVIRVKDPTVKKSCFRFFRELLMQWSSASTDLASATTPVPDSYRHNLCTFLNKVLIPGVFDCILNPSFDVRDANQARMIHEFANLLFIIKSKYSTLPSESYYQQCIYQQVTGQQQSSESLSSEIIHAFNAATSSNDIEVCLKEYLKVTKQHYSSQSN